MPLFMDLQIFPDEQPGITRQKLFEEHSMELDMQEKFGIRCILFIANVEARRAFTIMEAPDLDACIALHQKTHGRLPSHIIEMKGGEVIDFIGDPNQVNEINLLELTRGTPDSGYRTIVAIDYLEFNAEDPFRSQLTKLINETVGANRVSKDNRELAVFKDADQALDFSRKLIRSFNKQLHSGPEELRIGIVADHPVNPRSDSVFGAAIELAYLLCEMGKPGSIAISSLAGKLMTLPNYFEKDEDVDMRVFQKSEEELIVEFVKKADDLIGQNTFNIDLLAKEMGLSQSGLYRKFSQLAGISVVSFLQERRLRKSISMIRSQAGNISEIAYQSGFSSPSYFTRSFKKRFGVPPFLFSRKNTPTTHKPE